MVQLELTEEELLVRGDAAARILSDVPLMGFIAEMAGDRLACLANTLPEDREGRETLYFEHRGLADLVAHLKAYALTASDIRERDAEVPDDSQMETD